MLAERSNPKGKKVSLFVTCLINSLFPDIGVSVVKVLRHLGVKVDFPENQTCCGQPAFNSGYRREAREVALSFLNTFENSDVIVTPSGSCAAMIRHEYPELFKEDDVQYNRARNVAAKTWELSEFISDGLGIKKFPGKLPQPLHIAFHDSCHGLRILGLGSQVRELLASVENIQIDELANADVCCGFGGLFSVKMSDVSGAMLQKKINDISACPADVILAGDSSCLMHIQGGLDKKNIAHKTKHFIEILAEAITNED